MGLTAMFALAANAQTVVRVKNPYKITNKRTDVVENSIAKNGAPVQVNQIAGNMICNTQYVAGSTMDLEFTLNLTNTDSEYGDLLTLTFPAGITPNSSPNNPFASDAADPGPDGPEALNPIAGQVISWGNNDNNWGGIVANASYNFTVNVTIGAGVTGNQTANFDLSGDGFGAAPGDLLAQSTTIFPAGAMIVDLKTTFIQPLNLTSTSNCNYGMDTLVAQIKNAGTTTESNINVMYSINGGTSVMTVVPGPLAPGDSSYVFWLPAADFTATNSYKLKAWVAQAGDATLTNDTSKLTFANHVSVPLTSVTYTNGIESTQDAADLGIYGSAAGFTGFSTGTFHSGVRALFTTVAATNPAGTYSMVIGLPCMDVVTGEVYRISYWRKTAFASGGNGMSGIVTGLSSSALNTVLKPLSTIVPTTLTATNGWAKDSVDYTATSTETRYFGILGQGNVAAGVQMNVRLDDIKIAKVLTTGIKTNLLSEETISLFPNPTSGVLNINTIDATTSVEVYNVIGEKVYSSKNLNKGLNSLDLSNLSNGSYFVKMNSNNNITTKKVVISK